MELSATVGRDLLVMQEAHEAALRMLFARMKSDVDRFVDEVYAPYPIRSTLDQDRKDAAAGAEAMEIYLGMVREEVESFRPDSVTDLETYNRLIEVVKEASASNATQAELAGRVRALGKVAVAIAEKVPSLAKLLA